MHPKLQCVCVCVCVVCVVCVCEERERENALSVLKFHIHCLSMCAPQNAPSFALNAFRGKTVLDEVFPYPNGTLFPLLLEMKL